MPALPAAFLLPLALLPSLAPPPTVVDARFDRADGFVAPVAVSHAQDLVPYGSHVRVTVTRLPGRTSVALALDGVAPDHEFPAHVHTGRCGADPLASGPHYQQAPDPVQPSTDPAYANADNELRLTVRTDRDGTGSAAATVGWAFRAGEAHSLVLHAGSPAGPHAAGDRVACVDVDF